ncbi:MAG TPA: hypothetical protein P5266_01240 [Candidatus Fermentibacter sp.]|nr:hypothetical protein [Candidatus Fermentibacter sp.]HRY60791.1 hypothetical protein [Candidatus Fermentibacter sp.]
MPGVTRGWVVWTVVLGSLGLFLMLWGFGVHVGRWWPILLSMGGVASLCRGIDRRENGVLGFLLIGWGIIGVLALHHGLLGIVAILPFLLGALVLWIPIAILIAPRR